MICKAKFWSAMPRSLLAGLPGGQRWGGLHDAPWGLVGRVLAAQPAGSSSSSSQLAQAARSAAAEKLPCMHGFRSFALACNWSQVRKGYCCK